MANYPLISPLTLLIRSTGNITTWDMLLQNDRHHHVQVWNSPSLRCFFSILFSSITGGGGSGGGTCGAGLVTDSCLGGGYHKEEKAISAFGRLINPIALRMAKTL